MSRHRALLAASQMSGEGNEPITFYLEDALNNKINNYTIPYPMTWSEFIDSEYNPQNEAGGFSIY